MIRYKVRNKKELIFIRDTYNIKNISEHYFNKFYYDSFFFINEQDEFEGFCRGDCNDCVKFECDLRELSVVDVQQIMRQKKLERITNEGV